MNEFSEKIKKCYFKRAVSELLLLAATIFITGCQSPQPATITQISTIDALLAGAYDGQLTCGQLLNYGNTGIGTFDRLDGEMIVLDGAVYQIKADGKAYTPPPTASTPFAAVMNFQADSSFIPDKPSTLSEIYAQIDKFYPNQNIFYAIIINGEFSAVKTRSVPAQTKPYPPLSAVTKTQPEFKLANVSGIVVGFRCPPFVKSIGVPGYHLHFLSNDHRQGGHILDFKLTSGKIEIAECHNFLLKLPANDSLRNLNLTTDRSRELHSVEQGK
ncbi:MAG: acetolactate decarboxylase [Victivallaceae bacterium]